MSQRNLRSIHRIATTARPRVSLPALPPGGPSHRAPTAFSPYARAFSGSPFARHPTSAVQTQHLSCPSCHAPLPAPSIAICASCSSLLPPPPPSATLFDLFDLAPTYELDAGGLKKKFLLFQQRVHPDMFANQGDREGWAKAWSGRVNDGYKVLLDPRARGEYLLGLSEVRIDETDAVTEPELLMEVMEIREALEDAQTEEEVAQIRLDNKDKIAHVVQSLAGAFSAQPPDLELAKNLLIHYKYLENIEGVCREWTPGSALHVQH